MEILLVVRSRNVSIDALEATIKEGADVNARDSLSRTPLHCLLLNKSVTLELVNCLIKNGAKINVRSDNNETPLDYLFLNKSITIELVNCLIENGADITVKDKKNKVPFLYFMYNVAPNIEVAQHLLKLGFADNIKIKTKKFNALFQRFINNLCNVIENEEESLLQQKQEAVLNIITETISCFIKNNPDQKNEVIGGNFKYFNQEYSSVSNSSPRKAELYLQMSRYLLPIYDKDPNDMLGSDVFDEGFKNAMNRLNQKSAPKASYPLPPNLTNIDDDTSPPEGEKTEQLCLTGETSE